MPAEGPKPAQSAGAGNTQAESVNGSTAPRPGSSSSDRSAPGWLEAGQVRAMFDRIANVYDPLNTAMTAGLHHRWRRRAVDLAAVGPGSRVLDLATGTGDLAIELGRRVWPGGEVLGSDFSERMLSLARAKAERLDTGAELVRPRFEWADALELPYPADSFDAATVGFGVRNFSDRARGLSEMVRVVRPGGRVVILEMTTPTRPPLSLFYRLWFDRLIPWLVGVAQSLASWAARLRGSNPSASIADAYAYLPASVKRFPEPAALAAELERAGLRDISYLLTAGGIIAIHAGTVAPSSRMASSGVTSSGAAPTDAAPETGTVSHGRS
jgi:demethylmenaquinone methyltransferase / 2-methoxy-6-polyprenyl-1,4-benzoquinol methylase